LIYTNESQNIIIKANLIKLPIDGTVVIE